MIHLSAAVLLAPTAALTGSEDSNNEWLKLDRELQGMTSALSAQDETGPNFGLEMVITQQYSEDDVFSSGGKDLSGTVLRRARLLFSGSVGDTNYFISGEMSDGTMELVDAYASWNVSEASTLYFGQYKGPLLWSGRSNRFYDRFLDLPITGDETDDRTPGIMFESGLGSFRWLLSAQNGADGTGDDFRLIGRAEWDVIGDGAFGRDHGAYGYSEGTQLTVGVGFLDDGAVSDGSAVAGDVGLVVDGLSVRADMVQYAEDYDATSGLDFDNILGTTKADTTPATVTVGYLFGEDEWELLARWEEFDDSLDSSRSSVGLVWYTPFGPAGRWSLLYQDVGSDADALEGARFELGFSLLGS
ncbi:MAG: hypothetical protein AAF682_20410 [Planctomycetota bacterium]